MTTAVTTVNLPGDATAAEPAPELDLGPIRAREAAATRGPWVWGGNTDQEFSYLRLTSWTARHDVLGMFRAEVTERDARLRGVGGEAHLESLLYGVKLPDDQQALDAIYEQASRQAVEEYLHDPDLGDPLREARLGFVTAGVYQDARELAVYEVAPDATDRDDPRVYRADVVDLRHPDAQFIRHARADVPALLAEVDRLRAVVDGVRDLCTRFERGALRWSDPLPVPAEVVEIRKVAGGTPWHRDAGQYGPKDRERAEAGERPVRGEVGIGWQPGQATA